MAYNYSGVISGNQTVDATVGALTTFEGQQAFEYLARTTGTNTIAGVTVSVDTTGKYYSRRTATAEVSVYGAVITASAAIAGFSVPTESRVVWSPAWVDRRYGLALGGSLTHTYAGTSTSTIGGILGSPPTVTRINVNNSTTTRFVSIESVTVPAGTYNACKFEEFGTATPSEITTNWLIVGRGVLVKSMANTSAGSQTINATSVRINGQTL